MTAVFRTADFHYVVRPEFGVAEPPWILAEDIRDNAVAATVEADEPRSGKDPEGSPSELSSALPARTARL